MLVVVEGADGSGKSTLVEAIRKNPAKQYCMAVKASRALDRETHEMFTYSLVALKYRFRGHIICDRFHSISEAVYGRVLRGSCGLVFDNPVWDWKSDLSMVDLIIYCRPPVEKMIANLKNNPQMDGVADRIVALSHAYDRLIADLHDCVAVIEYDYSQDSASQLMYQVFGWRV